MVIFPSTIHCLFTAKPFSSLIFSRYVCSLAMLLSASCHIKKRQIKMQYFPITKIIIFRTNFAKHIPAGFINHVSLDYVISSSSLMELSQFVCNVKQRGDKKPVSGFFSPSCEHLLGRGPRLVLQCVLRREVDKKSLLCSLFLE